MNGIYFLANDVVADWVIVATESIRAKGCTLPICIIPFDAQTQQLERLAVKHKFQIWRSPLIERLNEIGAQFYPHDAVNLRMFRRLASFWGPYEHFIFTDVDIVALMNWDELLTAYLTSGAAFWYFSRSPGGAYKPGAWLDALRRQGRGVEMNCGMFASSQNVLTFERMQTLLPEALARRDEFANATGEQPFFNFYLDHEEIRVASASAHIPDLYDWNWAPSEYHGRTDFFEIADRTDSYAGKRFPCIHWAGFEATSYMPHRDLFLKYRLRHAPIADKLQYGWAWRVRPIFGNMLRQGQKAFRAPAP